MGAEVGTVAEAPFACLLACLVIFNYVINKNFKIVLVRFICGFIADENQKKKLRVAPDPVGRQKLSLNEKSNEKAN